MKYHMGVFFAVCAIALLYTYYGNGHTYWKKKCIQYIIIILSAFLGLRTWLMADLTKYHTQYVACGEANWEQEVFSKPENVGIRLFFRIENVITGGNYQIALFIIAVFCMSCLGYIIYKYSVSPYFSYIMYIAMGFYFFTFSGLKQAVAMAFVLLAFKNIVERKPGKFYLLTLLAALFHAPALIFLPAYILANKKIDKYYWLYLVGLFIIFFVFQGQLAGFLNELYYEEDIIYDGAMEVGGRFLMMLMMCIGGIILRPPSEKDSVYMKVFNITVFATLLQSFSMFGNEFSRLADYYFQFVVLYIPFVFEYRENTRRHPLSKNAKTPLLSFNYRSYQLFYLVVTVFSIWYFYNYIKGDTSGILNYKFFWEVAETPWGS